MERFAGRGHFLSKHVESARNGDVNRIDCRKRNLLTAGVRHSVVLHLIGERFLQLLSTTRLVL